MIRGRVDAQRQAWVQLEIELSDGNFEPIETVVDTGFDGHLSLPPDLIGRMRVKSDEPIDVYLATGVREKVDTWLGNVLWHDRLRSVLILESNGVPLLGMELLEDSQLTMQPRINGPVLIERLDEISSHSRDHIS